MAAPANVTNEVKQIIADQLNLEVAEITDASTFEIDLSADSMDLVEIIIAVEEEFDIAIVEEDAIKLETVKAFVDYVLKLTAAE